MIDVPLLLAFLVAVSILTLTPGVDTAMVLRAATVDGRRPAMLASIGIALGCLIWGAAVAVGLSALLRASELAYTIVRLAGAAYLIWLGIKLLLKPRAELDGAEGHVAPSGGCGAFWHGLLTNLLNPKVGMFYVTFLPQFVPQSASFAGYYFVLACLHVVLTLSWFAVLIAATTPLRRLLRRPRAIATLDRLTGILFLGFGLRLAASSAR